MSCSSATPASSRRGPLSSAAGAFRWTTLEEGEVTLRAWPWKSPPSPTKTFSCRSGKRYTDVVFRLPDQRPDISGVIVDASDQVVPLAHIDIQPLDPVTFASAQQERADVRGNWHVYEMPPGRYKVTASAPGRGVADTVVLAPRHDLRVRLGGTGRITGTTTELVNGSIEVSFSHCGSRDQPQLIPHEPRVVTVTGGRFAIENAPACTLTFVARWRDRLIEAVAVVEPNRTTSVDLEVGTPREKTVTGVVRDSHGKPVANARVTAVLGERESATARTDRDGRYTVQTHSGAQLVAGRGDQVGRASVGRANVASERVDLVLGNLPD